MSNELELNKDRADADRYYKLFADKVGIFNDGERILFIHIGNFDVLDKFIQSNKSCSYYIIDQHLNGPWFKMNWDCKFIGTNEDDSIVEALETLNMKFDKIIMNPPYTKNLHLKILAKAIEKLDKDGTCVNLSPADFSKIIGTYIGWNEDGKKNSTNWVDICLQHTSELEMLDHRTSNDLFSLGNQIQALGIWKCKKSEQNVYSKYTYFNKTFFKVALKFYKFRSLWAASSKKTDVDKTKKYVDIYKWHGAKSAYESIICDENAKNSYCLVFNSNNECVNFRNSITRWPYSLMFILEDGEHNGCKIWHLPWMGDAVNPRTGKKGYESEWTDEDFYKYFGITEDEQKLIEKTMEKYK